MQCLLAMKDAWDNNVFKDGFFVWIRYYRRTMAESYNGKGGLGDEAGVESLGELT